VLGYPEGFLKVEKILYFQKRTRLFAVLKKSHDADVVLKFVGLDLDHASVPSRSAKTSMSATAKLNFFVFGGGVGSQQQHLAEKMQFIS
jgi:hypothetical protein